MIEAVKKNTATKKTTTGGRGDEEFCALPHSATPVILADEVQFIRDFGAAKRPRSLGREHDLVFYPF